MRKKHLKFVYYNHISNREFKYNMVTYIGTVVWFKMLMTKILFIEQNDYISVDKHSFSIKAIIIIRIIISVNTFFLHVIIFLVL